jgi:hypothetical protein
MAVRRTTRTKRAASAESASAAHDFGVVLEDLNSKMTVVLEVVTSSKAELVERMTKLEERLSDRISVLEQVVRQNSQDVLALRDEVERLRHDFDHREERGRVESLEARVAALEARLGVA